MSRVRGSRRERLREISIVADAAVDAAVVVLVLVVVVVVVVVGVPVWLRRCASVGGVRLDMFLL